MQAKYPQSTKVAVRMTLRGRVVAAIMEFPTRAAAEEFVEEIRRERPHLETAIEVTPHKED